MLGKGRDLSFVGGLLVGLPSCAPTECAAAAQQPLETRRAAIHQDAIILRCNIEPPYFLQKRKQCAMWVSTDPSVLIYFAG